ncbi:MAG: tRNA (N6-isopentenyl adenosine(37)-C2)-methylthiotransferase MiaB [Mycoplasmoidaceae bacterium]
MKKRKIDVSKYFMPDLNKARKRVQESQVIKDAFYIPENIINIGLGKTFHVRTYGCQSNLRDSENIMGILKALGYEYNEDIYTSDFVILNTCAIRENAENKVFGEIGFLKQFKAKNNNFIFGIAGCMAQEENIVDTILKKYHHVDFIMGTHNIHRLPQIIEQVIFEKDTVVDVWSKEGDVIENLPSNRVSNIKACVNVMFGCDKFCTYCIVPFTRGKIRSRKSEDILNEIKDLIKDNFKEVTLIGQNVNAYGIDFQDEGYSFANLLEDVAKTNIPRIRFTTSNPWNFTDEIINVMSNYKNIMPHVHLPIQSGDDEILKKMNRHMYIKDYLKIIYKIRELIPNCTISTDLIIGFPNETKEQFQKTLDLYNEVKFDHAYTYIYSKRDGTVAAKMEDNISIEEKRERLQELNLLVEKYSKEKNSSFIGKTVKVLVEGKSKSNKNILFGYSEEMKVVNFKGEANDGDIVDIKIISSSKFSLNGEKI